uniref:Uncharacterized protein n=1 Tax=Clastoptera arizonana TaxID=38151 RepID=A0A1B6C4P7_9HEMI
MSKLISQMMNKICCIFMATILSTNGKSVSSSSDSSDTSYVDYLASMEGGTTEPTYPFPSFGKSYEEFIYSTFPSFITLPPNFTVPPYTSSDDEYTKEDSNYPFPSFGESYETFTYSTFPPYITFSTPKKYVNRKNKPTHNSVQSNHKKNKTYAKH